MTPPPEPVLKAVARRLGARRVWRPLRAAVNSRRSPQRIWPREVGAEVAFWRAQLPWRVRSSPDYQRRMDPAAPIDDPFLCAHLERLEGDAVSIIDVGAGPLTAVGKTFPGKAITVTPTDPLGDEYRRFMVEEGIEPPVWTVTCAGEEVLERFGPESFDVAFARNALDHSYDPVAVIENMVALVRPGGFVVLRHIPSVADLEAYRNLHQWNFEAVAGDFVIRRGHRSVNMTERLAPIADVECGDEHGWLLCSIAKRGSAS